MCHFIELYRVIARFIKNVWNDAILLAVWIFIFGLIILALTYYSFYLADKNSQLSYETSVLVNKMGELQQKEILLRTKSESFAAKLAALQGSVLLADSILLDLCRNTFNELLSIKSQIGLLDNNITLKDFYNEINTIQTREICEKKINEDILAKSNEFLLNIGKNIETNKEKQKTKIDMQKENNDKQTPIFGLANLFQIFNLVLGIRLVLVESKKHNQT